MTIEKIGFQYWFNGKEWQRGSVHSSEVTGHLSLEEGRSKFDAYAAEGNTIASWFEGTREDAEKKFPELF